MQTTENKLIEISLDATMFDTFVSCPQKYYLRFRLNRTTLEKAKPLDKGDLIHKGLEPYYLGLKDRASFEESLNRAKEGFNLAATESDLEPNEIVIQRNALIENINFWRYADQRFEILAVEAPFAYELFRDSTIRITMIGKIDLLTRDDKYDNLPTDHKSYSRDFPVYRKTNQFCNYAYATGSNYLQVNRVGLQTSLPPEKKHKRVPLSYDKDFLEQWKQNIVKWCYFYLECHAENSFPLNDTSCDKYGRLCEFYSICDSSGNEAKEYKLMTNFKEAPKWDVAKSLGLDK